MRAIRTIAAHAIDSSALAPGLAATVALALMATAAGTWAPLIGPPGVALFAGLSIRVFYRPHKLMLPGLRLSGRYALQAAVVVVGCGLPLQQVLAIGAASLPVLCGTLSVAWVTARLGGRRLGLGKGITRLIGVGTAVCGASAIAAVQSVTHEDDADFSYALTTILLFNVVAVVFYPPLGHLFGVSPHAFGLFAGTAINDTSSVVAAANSFSPRATTFAVVVKVTRTLAIVPICVYLALRSTPPSDVGGATRRVKVTTILPVFVLAFVGATALRSIGALPSPLVDRASTLSTWLATVALAGSGLSADPRRIRASGARPLLLGGLLSLAVGIASLILQAVGGTV